MRYIAMQGTCQCHLVISSDFFSRRNNKKQLRTDGGTIEQYLCRPTAKFEKTFLPPLLVLPRKHEKTGPSR